MGLGIILFGFFFLHFHYLNLHIQNTQIFPLSICLPIIILGFLYAYRNSRKKEYLYFIIPCIVLIILTFIKDVRFLYLLLLTFTYLAFALFFKHQVSDYSRRKALHIWLIVYSLSGFLKAATSMNGLWFDSTLNYNASLMFPIAMIGVSYHLWKIKKLINIESHPQITPPHIPIYIQLITILLCIIIIIVTHTPFVQHSYDQSNQIDIYEFSNEQIKVRYFIEWGMSGVRVQDAGVTPDVEILDESRPQNFSILLNDQEITKGSIHYAANTYQYIEEESQDYNSYFEMIPDCTFLIDGQRHQAEIQKVEPVEYGYQDSHINMSHCIIENNRLYVLPRIEFYNQKNMITNISVTDSQGKSLFDTQWDEMDLHYNDGVSFYPETVVTDALYKGQGPYYLYLTYTTKDNKTITKKYPLTQNEDNMS